MTNFQRSYSRVFYGNDDFQYIPAKQLYSNHAYYQHKPNVYNTVHNLSNIAEESTTSLNETFERRTRPGSLRSHDSGFTDSEQSPNTSTSSSSHLSRSDNNNNSSKNDSSSAKIDENRNYLSPKQSHIDRYEQQTSIHSETPQTPPTVIRKKRTTLQISPAIRRISFSAPTSPEIAAHNSIESSKSSRFNDSFRSLDSFMHSMFGEKDKSTNSNASQSNDESPSSINRNRRGSKSLRRGKTISPSNNANYRRRRLLNCVSKVSDSVGDVYTLSTQSESQEEQDKSNLHHSYESLVEIQRAVRKLREDETIEKSQNENQLSANASYNNETVIFGNGNDESGKSEIAPSKPRPPLPSYDDLYPPNGSSTPKMLKIQQKEIKNLSQQKDHTHASIITCRGQEQISQQQQQPQLTYQPKVSVNGEFFDSDFDLSLPATFNWETCTYLEYTNPLLNGNAPSVQFWLDEIRTSYCHEILSTLQTKSILYEAAKSLKLNPAIASKLIYQIQLRAIDVETHFEEVERLFESHSKFLRKHQHTTENESEMETVNNKFKEYVAKLMRKLTTNICHFMSKLNSKTIFQQPEDVIDRKKFEKNIKMVIEMSRDLQVACDTKIDDIEISILLTDLLTLKQTVLKAIRKVFCRLVNIIVSRIEDVQHKLLLRANINMIATLPAEGVYNSSERFSSLTDAFITCGTARVLLLLCLDSKSSSIRSLAMRALATICSTPELIQQFLEIGGLDVISEIITDEKRCDARFEPELREAVSVLTQVTAPWHHDCNRNIDDLLKISVDKIVTRLTVLISTTECSQTLMLCIACLNNLSRKSPLTFYSLMSNQTVSQIICACDHHQRQSDNKEFLRSLIFLYVNIIIFCVFFFSL